MATENLLILDWDETLDGEFGIYQGTEEFVLNQRKQEIDSVVATLSTRDYVEFSLERAKMRFLFTGVFGWEELTDKMKSEKHWFYVEDSGTKSYRFAQLSAQEVMAHNDAGIKLDLVKSRLRTSRIADGLNRDKDLTIVKRSYNQIKGKSVYDTSNINAAFIGNEQDVLFADSDKTTPMFIVEPGGEWLRNGFGQLFVDTMFSGIDTTRVYDSLYCAGRVCGSFDSPSPSFMRFPMTKSNCKVVRIANKEFIFSNRFVCDDGLVDGVRLVYPDAEVQMLESK